MQLIPTATDAILFSSFFPGTLNTFSIHKTEKCKNTGKHMQINVAI
jgi:hypothetical protein